MKRSERWRQVLNQEVARWSSKSCAELRAQLKQGTEYEVEFDSITHQVEVEILEDTDGYVHVCIAVDDGTLPASISPASESFIRKNT